MNLPVRAFVRKPEKAGLPSGVELWRGDVRDAAEVRGAIAGADAVISCLGAKLTQTFRNEGKVNVFGMPNIVNAMQKHGVRRIVAMSTYGAGDSAARLSVLGRLS